MKQPFSSQTVRSRASRTQNAKKLTAPAVLCWRAADRGVALDGAPQRARVWPVRAGLFEGERKTACVEECDKKQTCAREGPDARPARAQAGQWARENGWKHESTALHHRLGAPARDPCAAGEEGRTKKKFFFGAAFGERGSRPRLCWLLPARRCAGFSISSKSSSACSHRVACPGRTAAAAARPPWWWASLMCCVPPPSPSLSFSAVRKPGAWLDALVRLNVVTTLQASAAV